MSDQGTARSSVRFRIYEALTGWMLVRMAKIAAKRLDLRELGHISAQLEVGESVDCAHVRAMASPSQMPAVTPGFVREGQHRAAGEGEL